MEIFTADYREVSFLLILSSSSFQVIYEGAELSLLIEQVIQKILVEREKLKNNRKNNFWKIFRYYTTFPFQNNTFSSPYESYIKRELDTFVELKSTYA